MFNSVFACAAWCLARPTRVGGVALAVFATLWLFVNKPFEGRTLIVVTEMNGVTESDLISLAGLLLAAWTLRKSTRRRVTRDDR